MSTQDERKTIINKYPIYRGLTLLLGMVITMGLLLGAILASSARDLLAGTGLGDFMGAKANEGASLGILTLSAVICVSIIYLRNLYFLAKNKELQPVP